MGKRCQRKGKETFEPYVKLDNIMMSSAAWTSLSLPAVWVYIELRRQFNFAAGGNEHLVLPYSKITWRLCRTTAAKAFRELCEFGFIRRVATGGMMKSPNIFALSDRWREVSKQIFRNQGKAPTELRQRATARIRNLEGHRTWEKE